MRLVKFLANAGVASRRASEPLIAAGRVTVNGEPVTDPARDVSEVDRVLVDGASVTLPGAGGLAVYAVNKPAGVVSTASDPQGRATVVSLVRSDTAPVSGRAAGHRHDRADAPDQRRRARASAHAPQLRGAKDLPRGRATRARDRRAAGKAARWGAARGRADRAGGGSAGRARHVRADDPRRPQPSGQADVRGDRPPGQTAGADRVRAVAAGRPGGGPVAAAERGRDDSARAASRLDQPADRNRAARRSDDSRQRAAGHAPQERDKRARDDGRRGQPGRP